MLRILIQNRPDARCNPGGDTVQMDETVRALRDAGHRVEVSLDPSPELSGYDVVHLFNLTRPFDALPQARNALGSAKPYVLSSVYWDLNAAVPWYAYEFPRNWLRRLTPDALRKRLRRRGRSTGSARPPTESEIRGAQSEILRGARRIFPNSQAERDHILARFPGVPADRMCVVQNGVAPPSVRRRSADLPTDAPFICLGAIGPRKNQLNLVRAFRRMPGEQLVIYGRPAIGSERYARACRRIAGPNVAFRDPVPHSDVPAQFAGAKALVQPSWIETPGLAAMEALACGVPIVVSDAAPVREYFGASAHYVDPASPDSIAAACRMAAGVATATDDGFAARYDWKVVLRPLVESYAALEASFLSLGG